MKQQDDKKPFGIADLGPILVLVAHGFARCGWSMLHFGEGRRYAGIWVEMAALLAPWLVFGVWMQDARRPEQFGPLILLMRWQYVVVIAKRAWALVFPGRDEAHFIGHSILGLVIPVGHDLMIGVVEPGLVLAAAYFGPSWLGRPFCSLLWAVGICMALMSLLCGFRLREQAAAIDDAAIRAGWVRETHHGRNGDDF